MMIIMMMMIMMMSVTMMIMRMMIMIIMMIMMMIMMMMMMMLTFPCSSGWHSSSALKSVLDTVEIVLFKNLAINCPFHKRTWLEEGSYGTIHL